MAKYTIEDTTLTALGDATRKIIGVETRLTTEPVIAKIGDIDEATGQFLNVKLNAGNNVTTVTIPGATNIIVKVYTCGSNSVLNYLEIGPGETIPEQGSTTFETKWNTLTFENTDTVTFLYYSAFEQDEVGTGTTLVTGYYAECYGEMLNTMTPGKMAEELNTYGDNILPTPTAEELTITGDCRYRFSQGGWNWVIKKYGSMITTKDITNGSYMFDGCDGLTNIPFDINFNASSERDAKNLFYGMRKLLTPPKVSNLKAKDISAMFQFCNDLQEVPQDFCDTWDWSYLDGATGSYNGNSSNMFYQCYCLRSFPMTLFEHGNPVSSYSYTVFRDTFYQCYALDEIIGMPNPHYNATYTGSGYSGVISSDFLEGCFRLKNFIFAENITAKWGNQTLDLSQYVGWVESRNIVKNIYWKPDGTGTGDPQWYDKIGISDKEVTDDATYQALKDDPDWFTCNVAYSRYNHDSAVATINSLPDCSATGTNTIKFKGEAGSKTDGGAINTLTADEIAVATAKGWTVTLV